MYLLLFIFLLINTLVEGKSKNSNSITYKKIFNFKWNSVCQPVQKPICSDFPRIPHNFTNYFFNKTSQQCETCPDPNAETCAVSGNKVVSTSCYSFRCISGTLYMGTFSTYIDKNGVCQDCPNSLSTGCKWNGTQVIDTSCQKIQIVEAGDIPIYVNQTYINPYTQQCMRSDDICATNVYWNGTQVVSTSCDSSCWYEFAQGFNLKPFYYKLNKITGRCEISSQN